MCLELIGRTIHDEEYLERLKIPEAAWPLIAASCGLLNGVYMVQPTG